MQETATQETEAKTATDTESPLAQRDALRAALKVLWHSRMPWSGVRKE